MSNSILVSTKKTLGLMADYTSFDPDIIMFINSAFASLNQIGVGPEEGFAIEDDIPSWTDFVGSDPRLNQIKTYVFLKVKMLFDPPGTSYLLDAYTKQILEHEWRLNVHRESINWTDPNPIANHNEDGNVVYDGGTP